MKKIKLTPFELAEIISNAKGESERHVPTSTVDTFFEVGKNYLIRTVTMTQTGKLVDINAQELVLEHAAWIADTGKFSEALTDISKINEVEMFPGDKKVIVGRGALIDAVPIYTLPESSK